MNEVNDEELNRELEALQHLRREVSGLNDPVPSRRQDDRFEAMLADQSELNSAKVKPLHLPDNYRGAALMAIAASLLLLVFGLGWYFGQGSTEGQLAATRTLMLELMEDEVSTTRMRAATVSLDVPFADPTVIANLGHMLRTDPNTNVRLAALDALRRFAGDRHARSEMLDAMGGDPPPAVRVQLLETLVRLEDKRVLPYLQELLNNDSIPRPLRDAAELGTFKLI